MKPHVSGITLGVEDVERAKRFYSEGLGWPVEMDTQGYVAFSINKRNGCVRPAVPRGTRKREWRLI
jgi:predicted enzyme related to lactoylglutathione lyase